jgi:ABC-type tungstate transport system substrate-binding protein
MTTRIAPETSKGNPLLALGLVLIGISMAASATVFALDSGRRA